MRSLVLVVLAFLCACQAEQPESIRTVEAYEVPLANKAERDAFLEQLGQIARSEGLHIDRATDTELSEVSYLMPEAAMTIDAAVWRGEEDDHIEADVSDLGHAGRVRVLFLQGEDPELATRFREWAIREVLQTYPETRILPVMPTGAIPLPKDLCATEGAYQVKSEAAEKYGLPASSPLICNP